MVVGHYGCGGVLAALNDLRMGLVDNWIRHVKDVRDKHRELLAGLPLAWRHDALCELNAIEQVMNVAQSTVMQDAWAGGQKVTLHGWCYGLKDGLITNLQMTLPGVEGADKVYQQAVQLVASRERS
ncbi:Carbonic anhydrase 2 [compost metagenome]